MITIVKKTNLKKRMVIRIIYAALYIKILFCPFDNIQ